MAFERVWKAIPPILFAVDGTADGKVVLSSTSGFKVKQTVLINATGKPTLRLEVKKVPSRTTLVVGPIEPNIESKTDISAYTIALNATIEAPKQNKSRIPRDDHYVAVYEQEPTVGDRVVNVDEFGDFYSLLNPLPTDTTVHYGNNYLAINPDGSINVVVTTSTPGIPISYTEAGTITDTTITSVATFTAISNNSQIHHIIGTSFTMGLWYFFKKVGLAETKVGMIWSSPMNRNGEINFYNPITLNAGEKLVVKFQAERYRSELLTPSSDTWVLIEGSVI